MILNKMDMFKITTNKINICFLIILCKILSIFSKDNKFNSDTIILNIQNTLINKTLFEKEEKEQNFYNLIVNKLVPNNLYIDINVNSENFIIPGYLTFSTQYNFYGKDTCLKLDDETIFNISSINEELSYFQIYNNQYQKYYYLYENISIFDKEKNLFIFNDIEIVISEKIKTQTKCLIIGLNPIFDLKQNKGIKNLPLSFKLNTKSINFQTYLTLLYHVQNGVILLGQPPHIIYPDLFNIKMYKEIENFDIRKDVNSFYVKNQNIWSIKLNRIYIDNKIYPNEEIYIGQFSLDYIPFLVPMEIFKEYINIGLNYYLSKNICTQKGRPLGKNFAHSIINDKKQTFIFISCQKDKIENITEFYESLPEFSFRNKDLNITFKFEGKELFVEEGNFLVLMLMPDLFNKNIISLGKIFMEKYLFCFNYDRNVIGFYDENLRDNYYNKKNVIENKIPLEFIFIIISIVSLSIFIILMKYFKCKKIKRNVILDNNKENSDDLIERELMDVKEEKENL